MKYLFVHQNFPAQFVHLLRYLAQQNRHELLFITENRTANLPGVRKLLYRPGQSPPRNSHRDSKDFEAAVIRAEAVARAGFSLKALGFTPDIVIGHHGWGELLNIGDVWPSAPLLGYHEFYYHLDGYDVDFDPEFPIGTEDHSRIRAKNAVNLLALTNPGHGQTPTRFQHETYPRWARPNITVLPEGVNLDICRPDKRHHERTITLGGYKVAPSDTLITYVVRDLEPYRGFHIMMRALPRLLRARPELRVILVGGDNVSYGPKPASGSWRQHMLQELDGKLDTTRVHFPGKIDYLTYVKLLQRSDAHVYLTYPFVASWSLRESLACGCALVASDTAPVREFVRHRRTGLLAAFHAPDAIADSVLEILEDGGLNQRLRRNARIWAEENLAMAPYVSAYQGLIRRLVGRGQK